MKLPNSRLNNSDLKKILLVQMDAPKSADFSAAHNILIIQKVKNFSI